MAFDVRTAPMTSDFTAPGSDAMKAALARLDARVPLGASDVEKALQAATAALAAAQGGRPKAVVYIGDGMSRANYLTLDKVNELVGTLVSNRIPVSACLVGARVDKQLMGTLAAETGGMLNETSQTLSPQQAGANLASAVHGAVLWPRPVTWPGGFTVLGNRTPPLRTDRDTVVVGTYPGTGQFTIQMNADGPAGPQNLSWTVNATPSRESNNYLARLVELARNNQGLGLPLVGSASLAEAAREVEAGMVGMTRLAAQALSSGDLQGAERMARSVLRQDPGNVQAQNIVDAVARRRAEGGGAPPAGAAPIPRPRRQRQDRAI